MINRALQAILFVVTAAIIGVLLYWQVDIINRGGPVMIPIVMCSIFSLALSGERLAYFFRLRLGPASAQFLEDLRQAVAAQQWKEALNLCESFPGPVARVAQAGLEDRQRTPQEIDETMRAAAHQEVPAVEQHLRWLSTLAQVSTLLGLLGTVTGLVRAFQVIQMKTSTGGPVSPGDLAGGVWEALITTVAGLTIAIPTIIAYNYFAGRLGEVQFQMEKSADIVTNWRRFGGKDAAR